MMITSKSQMYELYEKHAFGNKLRTWPLWHALTGRAPEGLTYSMRYAGSSNSHGVLAEYNVPLEGLGPLSIRWQYQFNVDAMLIQVNESAPDNKLVIQGEIQMGIGGLDLRYDTAPVKMRVAMAQAKHAHGLPALLMLRELLWPNSMNDIMELLDIYPESVIEFSAYGIEVGDCPGRNAVVWEVRNY